MTLVWLLAGALAAQDSPRPDLLVADFEGPDYGGWNATGDAFGDAPASGTLPGQMAVEGFLGRGLVNSFQGGDGSTGELTSPPFRIERTAINFLIGGGGWAGETCLDLLVDGEVVRTATGSNRDSGGSERLRWAAWDVKDLQGQEAVLRIVDRRKGGWGHINVDHIVQTDSPKVLKTAHRSIALETRYLYIPVKTGEPKVRAKIESATGAILREFDVELASGEPDFFAFSDLDDHKGKTVVVRVDELEDDQALAGITQADDVPNADGLYQEPHRPQFHFSSRRGWLNDPNGLVWFDGEYHLYYQHNPFGWGWGNMHWGHAVSPDLVHWAELPIAVYPREYGDWAFSGSAVTDHRNTSGFQNGEQPPLVAAYTSTGRGECIIHSNDRGRTWTEFEGNPVIKHDGRDPRILWYAPGGHWVMVVYNEGSNPDRQSIDFYTSSDLKSWTFTCRIDGYYECPDLIELPIDGNADETLWAVYAADGEYVLGTFDGKIFTPTSGPDKIRFRHGNFYAAQTVSDEPKGRCIQIGWAREVTFPGSGFNQQMNLPVELTLKTTEDGPRLFASPIAELAALRQEGRVHQALTLEPGSSNPLADEQGGLYEIDLSFQPNEATFVELDLNGVPLIYDVERQDVVCKDLRVFVPQVEGTVRLQIFLDHGSIEVFANDGRETLSIASPPAEATKTLGIAVKGGKAGVSRLEVHPLKSSWTSSR